MSAKFVLTYYRAIRESGMAPREKFLLRMAFLLPGVQKAIAELIDDASEGQEIDDGKLLELLLQYLPEILKLIELFIGMIG